MNVVKAIRDYISKMVRVTQGMKVLLMDQDTTGIVSLVFSQSEILQEEVYLFEKLEVETRDVMAHLKAIVLVRPTEDNINHLKRELRTPKYGEYFLFFTSALSNQQLEQLASADEHEVVQEVQEFYADYYAINTDTWTVNVPFCLTSKVNDWPQKLQRITDGIASCCLSLKVLPTIRYQKNSDLASQVAQNVKFSLQLIQTDDERRVKSTGPWMMGARRENPPVLLILDRNEDPVTPLLTAWTYQAMVHQLIGIQNNRVSLAHVPGVREDMQQVVLSHVQDPFFKQNMYKDFGDLGIAIKQLVDQFQEQSKYQKSINTMEDIKRFVEDYPEFKKMSGNVSKHVAVMMELQRQVALRRLLDCSEIEQELACEHDKTTAVDKLNRILTDTSSSSNAAPGGGPVQPLKKEDAMRLVMLFSLRYESEAAPEADRFVTILQQRYDLTPQELSLIKVLRLYAGERVRTSSVALFDNKHWLKNLGGSLKKGLSGVSNIFTQHKPHLDTLFNLINEGKLPDKDYPFMVGGPARDKPTEVIVFIVGGVTYEEAAYISQMNAGNDRGCTYLLGGTSILNPYSFLQDLETYGRVLQGRM